MSNEVGPGPAARTAPDEHDRGSGWLMGRVHGVPVYVAPSWLIVAVLITVIFAPNVAAEVPELGSGRFVVSLAYAVLLYLSVLVHELGHALVALRIGVPVRRITLQLLGGVTEMSAEAKSPSREFLIAGAGPLLSLLLGGGAFAAILALGGDPGAGLTGSTVPPAGDGTAMRVTLLLLDALMFANIAVGVFNLLPGLPLDGGVLLRAALWKVTGRNVSATIAAGWVGRVLAVAVFALPFLVLPLRDREPSLFTVLWAGLLAGFIFFGASQAIQGAQTRQRLPMLDARVLTRRAIGVHGQVPLAEALRRADAAGAAGMVVIDTAGRPSALVNEASVAATPEQRRPWVSVDALARRLEPGLVLSAELAGEQLVQAMHQTPASEYLVVGADGDIFGVLATVDVERAASPRR